MKKIDDSDLNKIDGAGGGFVRPSMDMDNDFAPVKSETPPGGGGPGGPGENPDTAGGGDDTSGGLGDLQEG